ncbi:NnrU family protein [Paraburkholderia phosphatilytica]|uniref:NnrU family protein n=1 Tax=Paraburkholderia phosphatilytica TaxID=2282883 RepID=UPI000E54694F|nr:NnrU family protein [Paraburkholderia phosphatilytica]
MALLIIGLVMFLGVHSVRIVAEPWRRAQIERLGERRWKNRYSVVSLIGLVVLIYGYGLARREPVVLWAPPVWGPHLAALFTAVAFILFPAAHVPNNHFKSVLHHPMTVGVALWAFVHLLAVGTLNAVVLFGAFLVWSLATFAAAVRRDRVAGTLYPPGEWSRDAMAVVSGLIAWALFAFLLHGWLIGVRPLG